MSEPLPPGGDPIHERVSLRDYAALLGRYLRPYGPRVALLALLIFAGIGLRLAYPQVVRFFIDTARDGGAKEDLIWAAGVYLAIGLARQFVFLGGSYLGQDVGWRVTNTMRGELADHCLRLDMGFHNEHTPGELVERVDGDTTTLSNFFSQFSAQVRIR